MKEGFIIKANWFMFKKPILDNLYLLGAIYEQCDPKPDIDSLTKFYHDFVMQPKVLKIKEKKHFAAEEANSNHLSFGKEFAEVLI